MWGGGVLDLHLQTHKAKQSRVLEVRPSPPLQQNMQNQSITEMLQRTNQNVAEQRKAYEQAGECCRRRAAGDSPWRAR